MSMIKNMNIKMSLLFGLILLLGCGPSTRMGNRQNRFGTGLAVTSRVVNLPSSEKGFSAAVFIAEARYSDLQFIKTSEGYSAEVELTFSLQNKQRPEQVYLVDRRRKIDLKEYKETIDREKVLRVVETVAVPAGEYTAGVMAADRFGRNEGFIAKPQRVNDFLDQLALSEPLLTWDSLAAFQPDKLIPFRQNRYEKDFYTLVAVGGLKTEQPVVLQYELRDSEGKALFTGQTKFVPPTPVVYSTLPIPAAKLAMGVTVLKIVAEQNGVKTEASLSIYANVGVTPKPGQSLGLLVEPMRYIMDNKDWQALKEASPDERVKIFKVFWSARQPAAGQEENPLQAEFFVRVQEANFRYAWAGIEGWRADRGRIFIIYGDPDNVQRQRDNRGIGVYEVWIYAEAGRKFWFYDHNSDGDFRLISGG